MISDLITRPQLSTVLERLQLRTAATEKNAIEREKAIEN